MPWWVLAVLLIGWATLTPQLGQRTRPFVWCLGCGPNWLADFIANVVLFAPLGATLVYARLPLARAMAIGLAMSIVIELMQRVGVATGRTPALADIVANTLGAAAGAWAVARAGGIGRHLVAATPRHSRILLALWTPIVSVMLAATAWAVAPAVRAPIGGRPTDPQSEQATRSWLSTVPASPFVQSVLRGTVNGVSIPVKTAGQIIAAVAPADTLRITLLRQVIDEKDRRDKPITLVYVHGPSTVTEQAAMLQFADDLILRGAVNASRIGLETPALRVRGVFALDSVLMWKSTRIEAVLAPGRISLHVETPDPRIGTVSDTLTLTPALGWTLIQPLVGATASIAPALTLLWLMMWFVPGGYWLGRAIVSQNAGPARALVTGVTGSTLWSALPIVIAQLASSGVGVSPLVPWQIVCGVGGAIVGAIASTLPALHPRSGARPDALSHSFS